MDESKQKTVPTGKVYKQIFDAEVQLVRALEKPKKVEQEVEEQSCRADGCTQIPVVKQAPGLLNDRQLTWLEGLPNESLIENPVVHRYYSEKLSEETHMSHTSLASHEVQTLPDVVIPGKPKSDIIERIAASRRERHESVLEDMHHELGIISSGVEPAIQKSGEVLMAKLEENNVAIDQIIQQIETDEDLMHFTEESLSGLWEEVMQQSEKRQVWIKEMDKTLVDTENERVALVRQVFSGYSQQLEKIAHLMLPDLQRLLDQDSQVINQTLLSNKRAYADLYSRLMMHDIEREKKLHTAWCGRVADWKRLHTEKACQEFREFINSSKITQPAGVAKVTELWKAEQQVLNGKRLSLIKSLSKMKPPLSTKTSVYQWNEQIIDISKQIDKLNQGYFTELYREYEQVCQQCLDEVDCVKRDLISRAIATESAVQIVAQEHCLPLVGQLQTDFEKSLEEMDRKLEEHNNSVLMALKSLFKYSQGAAHTWDVHELGLAKQERSLQEKLDAVRHQHDNTNQDLEAHLDIVMDRMRQDANEKSLKESLRKAHDMMLKIKNGYFTFHEEQMNTVQLYPDMVEQELVRYDTAVCTYFGVDRRHPNELSAGPDECGKLPSSQDQSRPSSQARLSHNADKSTTESEQGADSNAIPLVVSEVLNTAKGTTFYILTTAGEHGVLPAGEVDDEAKEDEEKEYLQAVCVPPHTINEVKKQILMNFLDHLEEWRCQAMQRASSVVTAKCEELNSELDLRLHLHEPRPRRAELDVHNVRTAELVMHNERVVRHCKGINQALAELKHRFSQMTQHHNQLAIEFRTDIESLETVFITATKSSNLVTLSSQLTVEQDKHMGVVRASLRQFRQHLDDTLQMLRQSNARFIKSFKLFSDGGNFCPEEIEDYRKRLEKMAQKIDTSEGFIMADLEGMEAKRLEQASKVASEFQDRFKHHMVDLVFMEKIARWLTNTQVKIKAEVADSNSQAQHLSQLLADLERRIDACEKPNMDKEDVTPTQLNASLIPIFTAFHKRSTYLDANKDLNLRPTSALQGNPAHGARVGFSSDGVPAISKPGKQPSEDTSVSVIKSIFRTQKDRLQFGTEVNIDDEVHVPTAQQPVKGKDGIVPEAEGEKCKSRQSQVSNSDTKSRRSSAKPGTAATSSDVTPKRGNSGTVFRPSKGQKVDRKYFVFGEGPEPDEDNHFLGKVKHVLRDALDGLLAAAEMYYRQKGSRPVTRPKALQENFDLCAEAVVQKTQSYYIQADSYHNQCLQELRGQLVKFESLTSQVPGFVIKELLKTFSQAVIQRKANLSKDFHGQLSNINLTKEAHQAELRPNMGHPQQLTCLTQLCEREEKRHEECVAAIEQYYTQQQEMVLMEANKFVEALASRSETLLLQFDGSLTVDDVNRGRVAPVKHATSELIRRNKAGLPLLDNDDKDKLPRGKHTWHGIPKSELILPSNDSSSAAVSKKGRKKSVKDNANMTASVTTAKTTLGHSAVVKARDLAYQEYKHQFVCSLVGIDEEKERLAVSEERWTASWLINVNKVKQLF